MRISSKLIDISSKKSVLLGYKRKSKIDQLRILSRKNIALCNYKKSRNERIEQSNNNMTFIKYFNCNKINATGAIFMME